MNPAALLTRSHRRPRKGRPLGYYFETTSTIDGSPIVVVFTGVSRPSLNDKTGAMVQIWILAAGQDPLDAVSCGADVSVCGGCKLRWSLGGACYVNLCKAPLAVYWAWRHGAYERLDLSDHRQLAVLKMRPLRLGAYGDPAAVAMDFWADLFRSVEPVDWTGYTHQWRTTPELAPYVMASVDSPSEYREARSKGWRTFRVKGERDSLLAGERYCPASKSTAVKCTRCTRCRGTAAEGPSFAIDVHGARARRFVPLDVVA